MRISSNHGRREGRATSRLYGTRAFSVSGRVGRRRWVVAKVEFHFGCSSAWGLSRPTWRRTTGRWCGSKTSGDGCASGVLRDYRTTVPCRSQLVRQSACLVVIKSRHAQRKQRWGEFDWLVRMTPADRIGRVVVGLRYDGTEPTV